VRETTGRSAKITLKADRQKIHADGEDVTVLTVAVVDDKGRIVPTASELITFKLDGPAWFIGFGNGDPGCHEDDKPISNATGKRSLFGGLAMAIVQSLKQPGEIRVLATAQNLEPAWTIVQAEQAQPRPTPEDSKA